MHQLFAVLGQAPRWTGSIVHTDGWDGYYGLESKGYIHDVTVLRGHKESASLQSLILADLIALGVVARTFKFGNSVMQFSIIFSKFLGSSLFKFLPARKLFVPLFLA